MRLKRILLNLTFIIIFCTGFLLAQAPTYVVTSASDTSGGGNTLRSAINYANHNPGTVISFNIAPGGVQKIQLVSLLPAITNPVTIDGTTQPGYNGTPLIEIAGDSLGAVAGHGLQLNGGNSIVKGLAVYGFHYNGIGAGISIFSSGNKVLGCYLGTDASGTTDSLGNERGITIGIGQNNYIGGTNPGDGNVIVGNLQAGILVNGPSNNFIQGNYIGVEPDGSTAMGNGGQGGIWLTSNSHTTFIGGSAAARNIISGNPVGINMVNSSDNTIEDNYIGTNSNGTTAIPNNIGIVFSSASFNVVGAASKGNVISGNANSGIDISTSSTNNLVIGNYIGTSANGSNELSNGADGILVENGAANNNIGTTNSGEGNVISGNNTNGVEITSSSTNNSVVGNYVGTNAAGTAALGNHRQGIYIESPNNIVGPKNLVSGNDGGGVQLQTVSSTGNKVVGNYIGTDINGSSAIGNGDGVILRAGAHNDTIGGTTASDRNIISGNLRYGIFFDGNGITGSKIIGNYIGTNNTGTVAVPNNWDGVYISGPDNIVGGTSVGERNLISGNKRFGLDITDSTAVSNSVTGNLIGTDASGAGALGNNNGGIIIQNSASNNTIGGSTPAERNIISGNGENPTSSSPGQAHGVVVNGTGSNGNVIKGNYIGTDITGNSALDNNGDGIQIRYGASNNTIGGTGSGEGNVISGNAVTGISIFGNVSDPTDNNEVLGNLIGLNASGTTNIGHPNGTGVYIGANASNNVVGGSVSGAGNFISGSGWAGIYSANPNALNNKVYGNNLGTDINKNPGPAFANRIGILLENVSSFIIGDTAKGYGNVIASCTAQGILFDSVSSNNLIAGNSIVSNDSAGISILSGTGNRITRNSIYSNGGLGIDLNGDGVTLNDPGDTDTGPNNLQNFPIITLSSSDLQAVQGTLNSQPNTQYTLEFFGNYAADPSGYGEGRNYLGTSTVTTDSNGNAQFTVSLAVPPGEAISATATDPLGNTSEFSQDKSTQVLTKNFGNHFVVNTTVSGIPLHWPNGQSTYEISSSVATANSQFPAAIRTGYATWNNLPQINYTDGGNTTSDQWGGNPDGINNNVWITSNWEQITGTDSNTIGVTRVRYNTLNGEITDADIAYNAQDFKWSTDSLTNTMDVQNVATHEIGHYGGLGDLYNPSNVPYYLPGMGSNNQDETMFGLIRENETKKRTLDSGDVAGIQFIYNNIKSSRLDIMLVFDGSSSYTSITNAFTQAKNSALELVSNLRYGDRVGIVELPNTVILPLTSIDNETVRSNVDAAINGMTTAGSNNLGSGIQAAQNQLQINGEPTHLPVMMLYSTGQESGSPTAESLLSSISSFGTEIFTIGYQGTNVAYQNNLNVLSDSTKGMYSLASGVTDIGNIINTYFQDLTGVQLTYFATGSSSDLNGVPQPGLRWAGAVVDTGTTGIEPGLRWAGSDFGLSLEDPDGNLITQDSALTNPNIQFFSGPNYKYYKIKNPKPGSWSLFVYGIVFPPTPEQYSVYVVATTDVTMDVTFNNTRFNIGDTVTVQAELDNGGGPQSDVHIVSGTPITDATVTADVTLPNGTHQTINLSHVVNGLYKAQFTNTSSVGNYIFNINASKVNIFSREYSQTVYFVNNLPPSSQIDDIINTVKNLPDSSFKKPPEVRRKQILKQLDITKMLIDRKDYQPTINILNELLMHMNASRNDNYVVTKSAQQILVPEIQSLVVALTDSLQNGGNNKNHMYKERTLEQQVPKVFELSQNYPNPFNPTTDIKYQIPIAGHVTLKVYNVLGQLVRTLVDKVQAPGYYTVQWDGADNNGMKLSSGIYIYRLSAGVKTSVKKMVLLK